MNRYARCTCGIAALLCLMLAGCLSQKRDIAQYRKIIHEDVPPAPASQPGETLSLREAFALANQYNERIAISGEDYVQALIARDQAISAFLPTLAIGNNNTWQNPPILRVPTNLTPAQAQLFSGLDTAFSSIVPPERIVDVPISGQITVFNGFRNVSQLRQAGFNISRQRALLLDLQATVLLDTAAAYYAVIQAEQAVDVLTNSIEVQEARVRDVRAKREAGLARVLDVSQTEAQAAATRVRLIDARSNVVKARALLGLAIGTETAVLSKLTDELVIDNVPDLGILLQQAQLTRQDLVAAKATVQVAEQGVYQAFSQYLPSATFSAQYFLDRQSIPATSDWIRLLTVNMPIFSAGLIEEGIRNAWSQLRQAKLAESLTHRLVNQQVQVAYEDFLATGKRIGELEIEVEAAAEALRQAEQAYSAGVATNLDRIQAQDALLTAQLQLVVEQYRYKLDYLRLLRQVGLIATRLPGEQPGTPMTLPAGLLQTPSEGPTTQPATTQPAI